MWKCEVFFSHFLLYLKQNAESQKVFQFLHICRKQESNNNKHNPCTHAWQTHTHTHTHTHTNKRNHRELWVSQYIWGMEELIQCLLISVTLATIYLHYNMAATQVRNIYMMRSIGGKAYCVRVPLCKVDNQWAIYNNPCECEISAVRQWTASAQSGLCKAVIHVWERSCGSERESKKIMEKWNRHMKNKN